MKLIFVLATFMVVAFADDCPNCLDKCLVDWRSKDYFMFYQLINKIRGAKMLTDIDFTSFMMDGSANTTTWIYQKRLAAIVALTMPITKLYPSESNYICKNEFHTSIYNQYFAYFSWSWQCKDKCEAAKTLMSLPLSSAQTSANWLGGSCILGALSASYGIPCQVKSPKRMAIAFMNNNVQTGTCPDSWYDMKVAVKVSPDILPPSGFVLPTITPSKYSLDIDASYTTFRDEWSKKLLECLVSCICGKSQFNDISRIDENAFEVALMGNEKTETFRGISEEELIKKLLDYKP